MNTPMQGIPGRDPFDDRIRLALIARARRVRPSKRVRQRIVRLCEVQEIARQRSGFARGALNMLLAAISIEPICQQAIHAAPMIYAIQTRLV